MWKITTRGFTLEEVLIMAAMNLLTSADTPAKRENRPSQKSKGDQACNPWSRFSALGFPSKTSAEIAPDHRKSSEATLDWEEGDSRQTRINIALFRNW
jgi:hypothetical protein